MATHKLISGDNKKLKTRCEYTDMKKAISTVKALLTFARSHRCLGLAANQLGIMERVCIARVEGRKLKPFIDPVIVKRNGKQLSSAEGCLSFPGVRGNIWRPEHIEVQWIEIKDGFPINYGAVFHGMDAIILEHEIDHLDGIRCIDKMIR